LLSDLENKAINVDREVSIAAAIRYIKIKKAKWRTKIADKDNKSI